MVLPQTFCLFCGVPVFSKILRKIKDQNERAYRYSKIILKGSPNQASCSGPACGVAAVGTFTPACLNDALVSATYNYICELGKAK
jgi:hypothetical protein